VAENLAVLDYQQQEEVMLVVQYLSRVVSDGGTPVANHIETGVVEGSGIGLLEDKMTVVSETEKYPAVRLANASIVVVLALLTKNLLLDVYNLTEE
jgi:cohesin loading factor subunit SCC2